ncbi:MAG: C69 family dipeptidase, partial [Muribaculaceae bacterium]|nr:C69 family dipeptidase [Muribaculaceae bacterium]
RGCDARVWAFYNKYNKDMEQYLPWVTEGKGEVLPLWVKPDTLLSAKDMQWMMRDHFEDTPLNMTSDIGAGPWDVPYRFRPMNFTVDGKEYFNERAIATQQTGFSLVAQLQDKNPKETRGLLWFGTDDANTCVYLPIFCSVTEVPAQLGHGDINTLDWNSNFWVNNYVANQAYGRYSLMIPDIRRVQSGLEDAISADVAQLLSESADDAAATQALANKWAAKATADYKQLGDYLFVRFLDGNRKKIDDKGEFIYSEDGVAVYPEFPGYNERYYRSIVEDTGDRLQEKPIE